jgi:gas vesicle protein
MKMNNMKNTASDFASDTVDRVADAIHHGQDVLGDTTKSVGDDVSRAATKVIHATSSSAMGGRLATVGRALAAAASARAIFAAITPEEPGRTLLAMMNLQRRPSGVSRVARGFGFVALGAAVGVGAALLLAPKTGAQMRARIRTLVRGAGAEAEHAAESLGARAEGAAQKVEARVREAAHDIGTGIASMSEVTVESGLMEPSRLDASSPLSPEARARSRRLSDGTPKT